MSQNLGKNEINSVGRIDFFVLKIFIIGSMDLGITSKGYHLKLSFRYFWALSNNTLGSEIGLVMWI